MEIGSQAPTHSASPSRPRSPPLPTTPMLHPELPLRTVRAPKNKVLPGDHPPYQTGVPLTHSQGGGQVERSAKGQTRILVQNSTFDLRNHGENKDQKWSHHGDSEIKKGNVGIAKKQ